MNFQVILFDLDDTLCDTTASKRKVFEKVYENNPKLHVLPKDEVVYLMISERENYLEQQKGLQTFSRSEFWFNILRKLKLKLVVSELKQLIDDYWKYSLNEISLFPKVDIVLKKILDSNTSSALVAGGDFFTKASKLIHLGIDRYFNYVFTSDVIQKPKTSIAMYKSIIKYLEVEPKLIAMVGNDPKQDIIPAQKAGIITIQAMMSRQSKFQKFGNAKPDFIIYNIEELLKILNI